MWPQGKYAHIYRWMNSYVVLVCMYTGSEPVLTMGRNVRDSGRTFWIYIKQMIFFHVKR